jgi:prephenate dehydratase
VVATYDALAAAADAVTLVGEVVLPIRHCLLAPQGATLEDIEVVESHPIALAQCTRFLGGRRGLAVHAAWDTAGAARDVAAAGDVRRAAIAGRGAAERFGLVVLADGVEDREDNQTRFLVLARHTRPVPDGAPARTGLLATTDNAPGALVRLLAPLAEHALNLSALESRPTGVPWTYRFFLEVEHPAGDARLDAALPALRTAARELRVLGTWRRATPAPSRRDDSLDGGWTAMTLEEVRDVVLA